MNQALQLENTISPQTLEQGEERRPAFNQALLVSIGMTPDEARLWIDKTIALRQSCGCKTGAAFVLATILLYPLVWYRALLESFSSIWMPVLIWLVAIFVTGGVGKLAGLLVARTRTRMRLRAIQNRLKENTRHV